MRLVGALGAIARICSLSKTERKPLIMRHILLFLYGWGREEGEGEKTTRLLFVCREGVWFVFFSCVTLTSNLLNVGPATDEFKTDF